MKDQDKDEDDEMLNTDSESYRLELFQYSR